MSTEFVFARMDELHRGAVDWAKEGGDERLVAAVHEAWDVVCAGWKARRFYGCEKVARESACGVRGVKSAMFMLPGKLLALLNLDEGARKGERLGLTLEVEVEGLSGSVVDWATMGAFMCDGHVVVTAARSKETLGVWFSRDKYEVEWRLFHNEKCVGVKKLVITATAGNYSGGDGEGILEELRAGCHGQWRTKAKYVDDLPKRSE